MNTQENNRLIAEFMGYEPKYILVDVDKYRGNHNLSDYPMAKEDCEYDISHFSDRYGIPDDDMEIQEEELRYHTSWDWLMPVVEKIEREYMYAVQPCWEHCIIDKAGENIEDFERIEVDSSDKLSATYGAVVEFIKWYNENK